MAPFPLEYKNASCHESLGCPITAVEYRDNYIRSIPSLTITVDVDGIRWQSTVFLKPGDYNEHFQKLLLDPAG